MQGTISRCNKSLIPHLEFSSLRSFYLPLMNFVNHMTVASLLFEPREIMYIVEKCTWPSRCVWRQKHTIERLVWKVKYSNKTKKSFWSSRIDISHSIDTYTFLLSKKGINPFPEAACEPVCDVKWHENMDISGRLATTGQRSCHKFDLSAETVDIVSKIRQIIRASFIGCSWTTWFSGKKYWTWYKISERRKTHHVSCLFHFWYWGHNSTLRSIVMCSLSRVRTEAGRRQLVPFIRIISMSHM